MPISKEQFVKEILELLDKHTQDLPQEERGEAQAQMLQYTFGGGLHGPVVLPMRPRKEDPDRGTAP
jgi:hypothetical protein